jgi:signal transduction histidine kinase
VNKDQQGAGLGLAIALQICEFHQAKIQLSQGQFKGLKARVVFSVANKK